MIYLNIIFVMDLTYSAFQTDTNSKINHNDNIKYEDPMLVYEFLNEKPIISNGRKNSKEKRNLLLNDDALFSPENKINSNILNTKLKDITMKNLTKVYSFIKSLFSNEENKLLLHDKLKLVIDTIYNNEMSKLLIIGKIRESDIVKNNCNAQNNEETNILKDYEVIKEKLRERNEEIALLENKMINFKSELDEIRQFVKYEKTPEVKFNDKLRLFTEPIKSINFNTPNVNLLNKFKPLVSKLSISRPSLPIYEKLKNLKLKKDSLINKPNHQSMASLIKPIISKPIESRNKNNKTILNSINSNNTKTTNVNLNQFSTIQISKPIKNYHRRVDSHIFISPNINRENFQDEFLSHYNEFSPSWRKACDETRTRSNNKK